RPVHNRLPPAPGESAIRKRRARYWIAAKPIQVVESAAGIRRPALRNKRCPRATIKRWPRKRAAAKRRRVTTESPAPKAPAKMSAATPKASAAAECFNAQCQSGNQSEEYKKPLHGNF